MQSAILGERRRPLRQSERSSRSATSAPEDIPCRLRIALRPAALTTTHSSRPRWESPFVMGRRAYDAPCSTFAVATTQLWDGR